MRVHLLASNVTPDFPGLDAAKGAIPGRRLARQT